MKEFTLVSDISFFKDLIYGAIKNIQTYIKKDTDDTDTSSNSTMYEEDLIG